LRASGAGDAQSRDAAGDLLGSLYPRRGARPDQSAAAAERGRTRQSRRTVLGGGGGEMSGTKARMARPPAAGRTVTGRFIG